MISAKILFENSRLEESLSLAYYSMYHLLMALFFSVGIKCENHSASIVLLKQVFDINNSEISFAKREKVDKQYYIDFYITKQDVEEMFKMAEAFNKKLFDFIFKLKNKEIEDYRDKLRGLLI